jgi:hypothetical protein
MDMAADDEQREVRSQRTHTDLYLVIGTAALQTFKACRI